MRAIDIVLVVAITLAVWTVGYWCGYSDGIRRPILPNTCAVGDLFLPKEGPPYLCVETNTWQ